MRKHAVTATPLLVFFVLGEARQVATNYHQGIGGCPGAEFSPFLCFHWH